MSGEQKKRDPVDLTLGRQLQAVRTAKGLKLRDVEELTDGAVSNAYLSQIERDKIAQPSPHILHALASAYGVDYMLLMELAGYVKAEGHNGKKPRGILATLTTDDLTPEEEQEVLRFVAFLRSQKKS